MKITYTTDCCDEAINRLSTEEKALFLPFYSINESEPMDKYLLIGYLLQIYLIPNVIISKIVGFNRLYIKFWKKIKNSKCFKGLFVYLTEDKLYKNYTLLVYIPLVKNNNPVDIYEAYKDLISDYKKITIL